MSQLRFMTGLALRGAAAAARRPGGALVACALVPPLTRLFLLAFCRALYPRTPRGAASPAARAPGPPGPDARRPSPREPRGARARLTLVTFLVDTRVSVSSVGPRPPERLGVARQEVVVQPEHLQRRAPPERLKPARELVVTEVDHLQRRLQRRAASDRRKSACHLVAPYSSSCSSVQPRSGSSPPVNNWFQPKRSTSSAVQPRSGARSPVSWLLHRESSRNAVQPRRGSSPPLNWLSSIMSVCSAGSLSSGNGPRSPVSSRSKLRSTALHTAASPKADAHVSSSVRLELQSYLLAAYLLWLRLYLLWPHYSPGAHRAPVVERRTYYGSTYHGHATHQVRIERQSYLLAAYLLRLYLLWPHDSPGAHRAPVGERPARNRPVPHRGAGMPILTMPILTMPILTMPIRTVTTFTMPYPIAGQELPYSLCQ
eukprot:scaffold10682_cov67-Phaeocystis_antarctica.AAC.4